MVARRREDLHELIDALPESAVPTARGFLRYLGEIESDPVLRAFMEAPEDDESVTPEEAARLDQARAELERGETIPWEIVKKELLDDEEAR
ncbi:MAG: hypothetical protein HYY04_17690 [Chloroflexi bacterium]|nr:hypothetical protein [Chloroflexota bacterium]